MVWRRFAPPVRGEISSPRIKARSLARQVMPARAAMLRAALTGRGEEYPSRVPWVEKTLEEEGIRMRKTIRDKRRRYRGIYGIRSNLNES